MIYIHVINKFTSTSHVPRGYAAEYVEALNELEILSDLWRFGQRNSRWDGHRDMGRYGTDTRRFPDHVVAWELQSGGC